MPDGTVLQQIWTGLLNGTISPEDARKMLSSVKSSTGQTMTADSIDSFLAEADKQRQTGLASGKAWTQNPAETQNPTRFAAFREQEAKPGNVFAQYLTTQPGYGQMSAAGREAARGQSAPLLESYLSQVTNPQTASSYRDWLGSQGGQSEGLNSLYARLKGIGDLFAIPGANRTPGQQFQTSESMYGANQNAQDAWLGPLLAKLSPLLRGGVSDVAQGAFNQWQGTNPELPWMQELARRRGFFGG